ncbi:fusion protein [Lambdina fiscellaria nucleopolyhedrovirus]|uniref:Fusion protein n=1 Tax=Lambdina fiscellaria nucleopolyhedrovirus TaxID=1642929 RepID=A0A0E3Z7C2_9ABAC|nr:fusion protein [Lambdina fiscellaria nucleopolyhedrovirus]AKC91636.1 fusion protein [Lambdina fiscellaria nucleopolyhedrovirus]
MCFYLKSLHNVIVVVGFFILVASKTTASLRIDADQLIDVKPINNNATGFYFQDTNRLQFVEKVWTFVIEMNHGAVFVALNELWTQAKNFETFLDENKNLTCATRTIAQTQFKAFVKTRILDLVEKHNTLDSKLQSLNSSQRDALTLNENGEAAASKPAKRKRRGVLNFVGTGYKYMFGLMDANDAALLHKVAQESNALNQQVKQLTDEMISLSQFEEHKQCVEQQRADSCVYMTAKMSLFTEQIDEIETMYINLNNAVESALQNNHIDSMVMPPVRLLSEMTNVTVNIPHGLQWPVKLDLNNINYLINEKIVKTHAFMTTDRKLLFILEVPLVGSETYTMYEVVPVPMCKGENNKCAIVLPETKYLAVSSDKRNYVRMDDTAEKRCRVGPTALLCYNAAVVQTIEKTSMCDIKILLDRTTAMDGDCNVRVGRFDSEIFHPIHDHNQWLYVLQRDTALQFNCEKDLEVNQYMLKKGTGTITGKNYNVMCKIVTRNSILTLTNVKKSLFTQLSTPLELFFNIDAALRDIDTLRIDNTKKNNNLNYDNLNGMTERLQELRRRENNNTVFSDAETAPDAGAESWFCWFVSFFNVECRHVEQFIAALAALIVCAILFRVYRCLCPGACTALFCRCRNRNNASVVRVRDKLQFVNRPPPSLLPPPASMEKINDSQTTKSDENFVKFNKNASVSYKLRNKYNNDNRNSDDDNDDDDDKNASKIFIKHNN